MNQIEGHVPARAKKGQNPIHQGRDMLGFNAFGPDFVEICVISLLRIPFVGRSCNYKQFLLRPDCHYDANSFHCYAARKTLEADSVALATLVIGGEKVLGEGEFGLGKMTGCESVSLLFHLSSHAL